MARPINFSLSMLLIEVQLKTQMPRIMKSTYPWHSCLFVSRLLLDLCGFAAFRAESLRLSVKPTTLMAARPPRRSLYFPNSYGKPEAFRTGGGKAAKAI